MLRCDVPVLRTSPYTSTTTAIYTRQKTLKECHDFFQGCTDVTQHSQYFASLLWRKCETRLLRKNVLRVVYTSGMVCVCLCSHMISCVVAFLRLTRGTSMCWTRASTITFLVFGHEALKATTFSLVSLILCLAWFMARCCLWSLCLTRIRSTISTWVWLKFTIPQTSFTWALRHITKVCRCYFQCTESRCVAN